LGSGQLSNQRTNYKNNALLPERIEKLNSLGIDWHPINSLWNEMYEKLELYKRKHGSCRVKQTDRENRILATWVRTQRENYRSGILPPDKVTKLELIGFEWDLFGADWERLYSDLLAYKKAHGDCRPTSKSTKNKELVLWVSVQRINYKKGLMSFERIKLLNDIAFDWNPLENDWLKFYEELKLYKIEHGSCLVPSRYKQNPPLGKWVANQRTKRKKGLMSSQHIALLDEIDFYWLQ